MAILQIQTPYTAAYTSMDDLRIGDLLGAEIVNAGPSALYLVKGQLSAIMTGVGLTYDGDDQLNGGVLNNVIINSPEIRLDIVDLQTPAAPFLSWVVSGDTQAAFGAMLSGADLIYGDDTANLLRGYDGNDNMSGRGGADTMFGGSGNDTIVGGYFDEGASSIGAYNYLRGEDGDDVIWGDGGFDDIHGNKGDDTIHGSYGDDWVVGGQNNDLLFGDAGADIVHGNMGDDTCYGGDGADIVRGGQHADSISGGAGDDWLSGDRGDDTISGGAGADIFHAFRGSNLDRILDFSLAEGDRIQLEPGLVPSVSQQGEDTIIDLGDGDRIVLVGVSSASLQAGDWFFHGPN